MCGIAGFYTRKYNIEESIPIIEKMIDAIKYRGPDDRGYWIDSATGLRVGHCRLSIIDLTPSGRQPMESSCGRYIIVLNGEIYNFRVLKEELTHAGRLFKGTSDTEVLLEAISEYGILKTLEKAVGMFAFALWDREDQRLTLARDRAGKKPLYFGKVGRDFVFASELKALREHPEFSGTINKDSITLFLRHSCITAPYSIYSGIFKLPSGSYLKLSVDDIEKFSSYSDIAGKVTTYWSSREIAKVGAAASQTLDEEEILELMDGHLTDAVRCRMISDVPLGAFLSGGVDSSTIVSIMQRVSDSPVKTFSIGFYESGYNEAIDARRVAEHLRTEHHELYVSYADALKVVPDIPKIYDEPFSDNSQIPTCILSKFAREYVTVALSGDGGDELFGGYNRHVWGPEIWNRTTLIPKKVKKAAGNLINTITPEGWDRIVRVLDPILPGRLRHRTMGDKMQKLAQGLKAETFKNLVFGIVSHWEKPSDIVRGGVEPLTKWRDAKWIFENLGLASGMMYLDFITYLQDDIMVKVDRATMGVGLEARAPFLDHRLIEFIWSLPIECKISSGEGKSILRKYLFRQIPRDLIERPKMGFEMPIGHWLREPLRDWAEHLLSEKRLNMEGFFNPQPIREKWEEHVAGKRNWGFLLWDILMFQGWCEYYNVSSD